MNYLILIGETTVLPALFGEIIIPSAVMAELRHPHAPPRVAEWVAATPDWVRMMSAAALDPDIRLGAGETEAISLAIEMGLPAVLMDERKGRAAAESRGLIAVGTLNILDAADEAGLLDFEDCLRRLQRTNFRIEASLAEAFTERVRKRRD
ncbi:MAG TPA: hypothetical protein VG796_08830 [Verrucomicrobiales bacterium]|nr:hypothetical protein [Verrucomicrobiales bacterium]